MQLLVLEVQAHKLETQLSTHQPACSSPGQKVTEPISWGYASDLTLCSKPPKFGEVPLAEAVHVCVVKGHSGLLSWM